jgi:UDP:flavonoid glycosyltransferase YjiC (YdhE family)
VSRVLLTWELGLHLGHLTRLLPMAQQLKADGHTVLVATRDIQAAAAVLGPAAIAFVQAPHLPTGIPLAHRATGYADILLSQGWSDRSALWGLTQSWLNLFHLFNPDHLILDYSPTVSLAARIAGIPAWLVGNGFELPPLTDPLPPFPGFSWATPEKAAQSEQLAVVNANSELRAFKGPAVPALRDLVLERRRLFATFPELDHYGARDDAHYIGPLLGHLDLPRVDWPEGDGPKIFVCLRPDTNHVKHILAALSQITARVVCVATGFARASSDLVPKGHIRYSSRPVDLDALQDAELCITYGAEGTMMRFLLAGVPQLIAPWHVETYMAARKVEAAGCGAALEAQSEAIGIGAQIESLAGDCLLRRKARAFAERNAGGRHEKITALLREIPIQFGNCGSAARSFH